MNAKLLEAMKEYLKKNGYDGLSERSCIGCSTERLCRCGVLFGQCKPAYKYKHINDTQKNCPDWEKCFENVKNGTGINACVYLPEKDEDDGFMFYHEDCDIHCRIKKEAGK